MTTHDIASSGQETVLETYRLVMESRKLVRAAQDRLRRSTSNVVLAAHDNQSVKRCLDELREGLET